jgi:hypothetical protein
MIRKANSYVADELANKLFFLHRALEQTQKIISTLEEENHKLRELLENNHIDSTHIVHEENFAASY